MDQIVDQTDPMPLIEKLIGSLSAQEQTKLGQKLININSKSAEPEQEQLSYTPSNSSAIYGK